MEVWRTSSKVKIGPTIINIDAGMEKIILPAIFHVNNSGNVEDIFEGEKLTPEPVEETTVTGAQNWSG